MIWVCLEMGYTHQNSNLNWENRCQTVELTYNLIFMYTLYIYLYYVVFEYIYIYLIIDIYTKHIYIYITITIEVISPCFYPYLFASLNPQVPNPGTWI